MTAHQNPVRISPPIPCMVTIQGVIDAYLQHCAIVGQHTAEAREERVRTLGEFAKLFGTLAVADCRAYMLSDWIEDNPRWRSSSTRKAKANQVAAVFNWAARQGRIDRNPFAGVSYPESEPRQAMPDVVIEEVCHCANKPFERVVRFLRLTACRLSEVCELLWTDIDWERGVLVIRKHKSRNRTHRDKIVVLVVEAVEFLKDLRKDSIGDGHVFTNNRGTAWNRRTLGQQLRRMKRRGLVTSDATLHGIRHQTATACLASGASINLVSHMLGHSDITITRKIYDHSGGDIEAIRRTAELGRPRA